MELVDPDSGLRVGPAGSGITHFIHFFLLQHICRMFHLFHED